MQPKTWQREFFEACAACALNRTHSHLSTLTNEDRVEITRLLNSKESPTEDYLKKTFPVMFPALVKFAQKQELEMRKSETVKAFCLDRAQRMQEEIKRKGA